jgi:hypothetical protein
MGNVFLILVSPEFKIRFLEDIYIDPPPYYLKYIVESS